MSRKKDHQFHFKQFSVRHDRSGMKVGTDGTLLGAWTDVVSAKHILDIGTGTGLIALMLAQRSADSKIEGVEIDAAAIEDAQENFTKSPWAKRLTLHNVPIQGFKTSAKFDLIVSNPPYFIGSYKPPNEQRITARHTESLTFQELIDVSKNLLTADGRLSVVLPVTEGLQFIVLSEANGLYCSRKWTFRTRPDKPVERLLLEFARKQQAREEGEILLYQSGETWSDNYQTLTQEFYLKL
jgi:tRNA1Val (adenine37-N6)-methyltransferase